MTTIDEGRQVRPTARPSRVLDPVRLLTDGPEFDDTTAQWNGAVEHRPAFVVRCSTTARVVAAVRAARRAGLPVSVRGGGHDWAGRGVCPNALVVDVRGLRRVSIEGHVATVGGGATSEHVARVAAAHGLAAVTGAVGAVGMVGLTLGGGYGPLCGRFGLAADNLLAAEVVLADGRVVHTGDDPDLLWALRGGGGNFGVVTSMEIALHPVTEVLAGAFTFAPREAEQVLLGAADLLERAPDELTVAVTLVPAPDGASAVVVAPTWSGDVASGRDAVAAFGRLGTPVESEVSTTSPLAKLRLLDGAFPDGVPYTLRTRSVAAFTPAVVAALLEAHAVRVSPGAVINIHHFHGAAARGRAEDSAFGERGRHHMVELIEIGAPGDTWPAPWPRHASEVLAASALPGGYPNLLGPDDREQAAAAYGPNGARLLAVKDRLDPDGLFVATPLPGRQPVWTSAGAGRADGGQAGRGP